MSEVYFYFAKKVYLYLFFLDSLYKCILVFVFLGLTSLNIDTITTRPIHVAADGIIYSFYDYYSIVYI